MLLAIPYMLLVTHRGQGVDKWTTQTFSEGVSLEVPVILEKSSKTFTDPGMKTFEIWLGVQNMASYIVSVSRLKDPEKTKTANLFSASVAGLASGVKGTPIGQRDIVLQGWPGLAVTIRGEDGITMACRMFRTKDCMIQVSGSFLTPAGRPPQLDRFFNSLKLPEQGDLKEAGAVLTRYPLGESGLSALFPGTPELKDTVLKNKAKTATLHMYSAEYALRTFAVAYLDIPEEDKPKEGELDQALYGFTEELLGGMNVKKGKQSDERLGGQPGLRTEFTMGERIKGQTLVYLTGTRLMLIFELSPKTYDAPKTIETFFHSVQTQTKEPN